MKNIVAHRVTGFLREQLAAMALTKMVAQCAAFGHEDPVTIMYKDEMRSVCPRCGHAE